MSSVPCTRSEGLLISMSSVTETSTSALGKQGEMLFFLVFQGAKLAVCVFVRMGVAPELWIKAEIVRGESAGVCQLPEPANDSSSCQRLWVEKDCGVIPLGASSVCRRLGEVAYQLRERLLKSHGSVHVRSPILHN